MTSGRPLATKAQPTHELMVDYNGPNELDSNNTNNKKTDSEEPNNVAGGVGHRTSKPLSPITPPCARRARTRNHTDDDLTQILESSPGKTSPSGIGLRRNWDLLKRKRKAPENGSNETKKSEVNTIVLRRTVKSQRRPPPDSRTFFRVLEGPYAGVCGFLSPTGTNGYSILTTLDGQVGTVNDDHVVEAATSDAADVEEPSPSRTHGGTASSVRDYFLDGLKGFAQDDTMDDVPKKQVEQSRIGAAASCDDKNNEDGQRLHHELLQLQQEELDTMYSRSNTVRPTAAAAEADSSTVPASPK